MVNHSDLYCKSRSLHFHIFNELTFEFGRYKIIKLISPDIESSYTVLVHLTLRLTIGFSR